MEEGKSFLHHFRQACFLEKKSTWPTQDVKYVRAITLYDTHFAIMIRRTSGPATI